MDTDFSKKSFNLWSKESDYIKTMTKFPVDEKVVKKLETFIMMNVTKQISVDNITLSNSVLEEYYPNSKQNISVFKYIHPRYI